MIHPLMVSYHCKAVENIVDDYQTPDILLTVHKDMVVRVIQPLLDVLLTMIILHIKHIALPEKVTIVIKHVK